MVRLILLASFTLALTACAGSGIHAPGYTYNEILIVNNSDEVIRNVKVTAADNRVVVSCEQIAALGVCSKRFGRRPFTQAPFVVESTFGSNTPQVDEIAIQAPAYFSPGLSVRAVFEYSTQGVISAHINQETPI